MINEINKFIRLANTENQKTKEIKNEILYNNRYNSEDIFIRLKVELPPIENNLYQSYSRMLDSNVSRAGQKLYEELLERI